MPKKKNKSAEVVVEATPVTVSIHHDQFLKNLPIITQFTYFSLLTTFSILKEEKEESKMMTMNPVNSTV